MSAKDWRAAIAARFQNREDLDREDLYRRYWVDLPQAEVFEVLGLIEFEYGIPPGLLRPEDELRKLLAPVPSRNPFRWMAYQLMTEDKHSELNYRLGKRWAYEGRSEVTRLITTIDGYVRAWCGEMPV